MIYENVRISKYMNFLNLFSRMLNATLNTSRNQLRQEVYMYQKNEHINQEDRINQKPSFLLTRIGQDPRVVMGEPFDEKRTVRS